SNPRPWIADGGKFGSSRTSPSAIGMRPSASLPAHGTIGKQPQYIGGASARARSWERMRSAPPRSSETILPPAVGSIRTRAPSHSRAITSAERRRRSKEGPHRWPVGSLSLDVVGPADLQRTLRVVRRGVFDLHVVVVVRGDLVRRALLAGRQERLHRALVEDLESDIAPGKATRETTGLHTVNSS